jgi:hypothetical protein
VGPEEQMRQRPPKISDVSMLGFGAKETESLLWKNLLVSSVLQADKLQDTKH